MCPQAAAPATIVVVVSNRIYNSNSHRRLHQHRQAAGKNILKKRLCVHPTTMFRIAAKINAGLIRSPKMVKYSPSTGSCPRLHHHHC